MSFLAVVILPIYRVRQWPIHSWSNLKEKWITIKATKTFACHFLMRSMAVHINVVWHCRLREVFEYKMRLFFHNECKVIFLFLSLSRSLFLWGTSYNCFLGCCITPYRIFTLYCIAFKYLSQSRSMNDVQCFFFLIHVFSLLLSYERRTTASTQMQ